MCGGGQDLRINYGYNTAKLCLDRVFKLNENTDESGEESNPFTLQYFSKNLLDPYVKNRNARKNQKPIKSLPYDHLNIPSRPIVVLREPTTDYKLWAKLGDITTSDEDSDDYSFPIQRGVTKSASASNIYDKLKESPVVPVDPGYEDELGIRITSMKCSSNDLSSSNSEAEIFIEVPTVYMREPVAKASGMITQKTQTDENSTINLNKGLHSGAKKPAENTVENMNPIEDLDKQMAGPSNVQSSNRHSIEDNVNQYDSN